MIRETIKDVSLPPFVANRKSLEVDNGRQYDWDLITDRFRQGSFPVTTTAIAAAAATSIAVSALKKAVTNGTILDFGGNKFARVSADAAIGATSISVSALGVALASGDVAWTGGRGKKFVPAGTENDLLASGKVVPSVLGTGGVTCYSISLTAASEDMPSDSMTGYGQLVSGNLFENLLPNAVAGVIDSNFKTELRARGGHWQFFVYSDNT